MVGRNFNYGIEGCHTEGGTYIPFAIAKNIQLQNGNGSSNYVVQSHFSSTSPGWVAIPYKYVKIKNGTGSDFDASGDQMAIIRLR